MKLFNPIIGMGIPWHIKIMLFFIPMKWSHVEPIDGFMTTWSIGYKKLFGVVYVVKESK